jgi:hypothetical protein
MATANFVRCGCKFAASRRVTHVITALYAYLTARDRVLGPEY